MRLIKYFLIILMVGLLVPYIIVYGIGIFNYHTGLRSHSSDVFIIRYALKGDSNIYTDY